MRLFAFFTFQVKLLLKLSAKNPSHAYITLACKSWNGNCRKINALYFDVNLMDKKYVVIVWGFLMDKRNRDSLKTRKVVSNRLLQNSQVVAKASGLSSQRRKLIKASAAVVPAIMTLRSGAAAAMTSSAHRCLTKADTPIITASDKGTAIEGIEAVLGDDEMVPPLDEWLRVAAWPGMIIYYSTGQSDAKPYYLIRKDGSSLPWDDMDGWSLYDQDGNLKSDGWRTNPNNFSGLETAWSYRRAFYGVYDYPGGMVFVDEFGNKPGVNNGFPAMPAFVSNLMQTSTTHVFLLCYYDPGTGAVTYYPMPREGDALWITGSCLCSINPAFQI